MTLKDCRLNTLAFDTGEFPVSAIYAPTGKTTFATYDFGRPVPAGLEFDGGADQSASLKIAMADGKSVTAKRAASVVSTGD